MNNCTFSFAGLCYDENIQVERFTVTTLGGYFELPLHRTGKHRQS